MQYALTLTQTESDEISALCFATERQAPGAWEKHEKFPTCMIALASLGTQKVTEKQAEAILDVLGGYALALDKLGEIEETKKYAKDVNWAMQICYKLEREMKAQNLQRVPFVPKLIL